jgi:hypothetical protein
VLGIRIGKKIIYAAAAGQLRSIAYEEIANTRFLAHRPVDRVPTDGGRQETELSFRLHR